MKNIKNYFKTRTALPEEAPENMQEPESPEEDLYIRAFLVSSDGELVWNEECPNSSKGECVC